MNLVTVYHGSSKEIKNPSLDHGRTDADFGIGFYVTHDAEMAEKWAARKGKPIVNVYKIDLDKLTGIAFQLDKAWLDFVCQNRNGIQRINLDLTEIDYITGATADDKLFAVIEQYESNLIDVNTAIECMNAMKIGNQIALISQDAINNLVFENSYELSETRRLELDKVNRQSRQETNIIVERVMKNRVQKMNETPAEMPIINRKKSR